VENQVHAVLDTHAARARGDRGGAAMTQPVTDQGEVARALAALFDPGHVIELRALHKARKRTDCGYFDHAHRDDLIKEAAQLNSCRASVYVTLNQLDPQVLARYLNRVQEFASVTASDANIIRRRWVLLDFDPVRPKDTSASDAQLEATKKVARSCFRHLATQAWPSPTTADSGNGVHLLYPCDLPNDEQTRDAIKAALEALAAQFDTDAVKLDTGVYNAGRIVKLYGTVANKGDHAPDTPWRLSRLTGAPGRGELVTLDMLQAIAPAAQESEPRREFSSAGGFNLEDFLSRLGIEYERDSHEGRDRFKLAHCPFNPEHGKGKAAIFRTTSSALGFKCQHNGCQDKHWKDVRALADGPREKRSSQSARAKQQDRTAEDLPPAFSEDALALEFTRRHGDDLRYVPPWGKWFRWDGSRWAEDRITRVYDLAREVCRDAAKEAEEKLGRQVTSAKTVAAIEKLARSDPRHAILPEQFDIDPYLFNTPGGTIDLRTGELRPHRREDLLTKIAGATPDDDADDSTWIRFLAEVTLGDKEIEDYLQRLFGYSLSADVRDHVLAFFYGTGGNGKNTLIDLALYIVGDYGKPISTATLMEARGERHPTDIANLLGVRLAVSNEVEEGGRWAEAKLKALTGDAVLSARFMRQDFFEFQRTHKLIVSGNHRPSIRVVDEAIRRRMHLVPFRARFTGEREDRHMADKLRAEASAVLAWMVRGFLGWQEAGLQPPAAVLAATEDYLKAEDTFGL